MSTTSDSQRNGDNNNNQPEFEIPVQAAPDASSDEKAESEAAAFAFGLDLESAETSRRLSGISNKQAIETLSGKITRAFMVLAAGLISLSFVILFFHFLAPASWLFLSNERIQDLKEFLLSGSIGATLAVLGKSQFMNNM